MTKIIAFAHKKQSGKSSSCNFLADYIRSRYNNNTSFYGTELLELEPNLCPVKIYSFADKLKQFAVECLGLTEAQAYGEDVDKNSLTHLKWEDMPGVITTGFLARASHPANNWVQDAFRRANITVIDGHDWENVNYKPRFMTAREVLQFFGTGICRKMYSNIWVDACLRQIKKDNCVFALIADCRFKNEGSAVQAEGGKVVDFTRCPFPEDKHQSEVDLDGFKFDAIIDNKNLTLREKNEEILLLTKHWGWL